MNENMPMPLDTFEGSTVVASVYTNDGGPDALLMVLNPLAPYYSVVSVRFENGRWVETYRTNHSNIIPAANEYADRGGDY